MNASSNTRGEIIRYTAPRTLRMLTWSEFSEDVVQDEQTAVEIAFKMLEGNGVHVYTNDHEAYEEFQIIDRDGVYAALMSIPCAEGGRQL